MPVPLSLSPRQRSQLKARAHPLEPVVLVGADGLTAAVLREIDVALAAHELIKVRAAGEDRHDRRAMLEAICTETGAAPVQHVGKVFVLYRPRGSEPGE